MGTSQVEYVWHPPTILLYPVLSGKKGGKEGKEGKNGKNRVQGKRAGEGKAEDRPDGWSWRRQMAHLPRLKGDDG